jgi:hypothetical protein
MMGWPLTFLSLMGMLYGLVRRKPADLLLIAWTIPYSLFLSRALQMGPHYFLHVLPFMLLMGARLLVDAIDFLVPGRLRFGMTVTIGILLAWPSLHAVGTFENRVAMRPANVQAVEWMTTHAASGAAVATMSGVDLPPNAKSIDRQLAEIRAMNLGPGIRLKKLRRHVEDFPISFDVFTLPYPWKDNFDPAKWDYASLLRQGFRYFILTTEAEEYLAAPETHQVQCRLIQDIRKSCRKLWEVRQASPVLAIRRGGGDHLEYVEIYGAPTLRH